MTSFIEKEREECPFLNSSHLGDGISDDNSAYRTCDRYGHPVRARNKAEKANRTDLSPKRERRLDH